MGVAGGLGYRHMRSAVLLYSGGLGKNFPHCLAAWWLCAKGWAYPYSSIYKNTQFLLEVRFSIPTMVRPQIFLHRTLKILGLELLWAQIVSSCIFLAHQGVLSLAGAVKHKALLLHGSQVNIEKRTTFGEEGFLQKQADIKIIIIWSPKGLTLQSQSNFQVNLL